MKAKNPHFNDIWIGRKIRFKRTMIGMSQKKLGSQLGVTFQQIQKYEKGSNRIGGGAFTRNCRYSQCSHFFFLR